MKEYLSKNSSGNYQLVNHRFSEDDIAVPEGAEILTIILGDKVFYKSGSPFQWFNEFDKKWQNCSSSVDWDGFDNALWKRQPINETKYLTQGENGARLNESIEQLRATAKTETLNDKVVSAEVARQKHSHYKKDVSHLKTIDVYRVLDLFNVESNAVGHAIKKLLCSGQRGAKDHKQDIQEAIDSLNRHLEMLAEDEAS